MDIVEITALCPERPRLNSIEVRKEWKSCRIEPRYWPTLLNGAPPPVRLSSQSASIWEQEDIATKENSTSS